MPTLSMPSAPSTAKPLSQISPNSVPILVDFLNTVPSPITTVLVGLAPSISCIRHAAEIASWKSSWYDSWLALAGWWALCLLAEASLKYLFPVAILFVLAVSKWTTVVRTPPPITELNLQTTISDLNTINALIPTIPLWFPIPAHIPLRLCGFLYPPYLILTYLVPLRIIIGIFGTIVLSWRAPWATALRSVLWNNGWLRWSLYYSYSKLSGESLPPRTFSLQPTSTSSKAVDSIRFLFTIYENQRWWMGLDWTAALLPGERPSWSSAAQHAVSPPNAFTLPEETTVYLPDGKGNRVKRTATWRWEEDEWRVLVKKTGSGLSRLEKPLPKDESPSASMLSKVAGKMKESSSVGSHNSMGSEGGESPGTIPDEEENDPAAVDADTDADGWIYGDNTWEGPSSKGGLGKYTRFRRWTRIAVVSEVVEIVGDGDIGIQRGHLNASTAESSENHTSTTALSDNPTSTTSVRPFEAEGEGEFIKESESFTETHRQTPLKLRQRLKTALHNV